MSKQNLDKPIQDQEKRYSLKGEYVNSEFAMEPGAPYGEEDAYFIEADLIRFKAGSIGFESFEQMEEFSRHLAQYVEICRKRREQQMKR